MTTQPSNLHTDQGNIPTSSEFGDRGDGTSDWYQWARIADGGDVATGATDDAAVTNSASDGTLVALTKGLIAAAQSPYPLGATPIRGASGVVAASSAVATLAAAASKTTYLAGFQVTFAGATAAAVVTLTVAGTTGGSLSYVVAVPAGATAAGTPLVVTFDPPIPASAVNTAITVTLPSLGAGNTAAATVAHGFQL